MLRVGDRVRIRKSSRYYRDGDRANPINEIGIIVRIEEKSFLSYSVKWPNEYPNGYNEEDLDLMTFKTYTSCLQ